MANEEQEGSMEPNRKPSEPQDNLFKMPEPPAMSAERSRRDELDIPEAPSLREVAQRVHALAVEQGWDRDTIDRQLLIAIGKVMRAHDELVSGENPKNIYYDGDRPLGFGPYLAEAVIHLFDIAARTDVDLESLVRLVHRHKVLNPKRKQELTPRVRMMPPKDDTA